MSAQYAILDALLVARVRVAKSIGITFMELLANEGIDVELQRIGKLAGRDPFRILDGRLQALRKSGKLISDRKRGWLLPEAPK